MFTTNLFLDEFTITHDKNSFYTLKIYIIYIPNLFSFNFEYNTRIQ